MQNRLSQSLEKKSKISHDKMQNFPFLDLDILGKIFIVNDAMLSLIVGESFEGKYS